MTIAIVQGEESDLPEVAGLFAAAFHDDPVIAVMIPGERNRLQRLTKVFLSELRTGAMAGGAVDLARREDDGRLVGAAAWESPTARPPVGRRCVSCLGWSRRWGCVTCRRP